MIIGRTMHKNSKTHPHARSYRTGAIEGTGKKVSDASKPPSGARALKELFLDIIASKIC
jgi:hypothetical protein